MIKAGIVGVSGYSGGKVLEILLGHPQVRVTYVSANNTQGKVTDIWPNLIGRTELICDKFNAKKAAEACDVVFLAVPHTVSLQIAPELLKAKMKVIDLSGDYRLESAQEYEKWYGAPHTDKGNLTKAVYGLPELYREQIKKAQLISNPGCYPTAAILALAPLAATKTADIQSIIIDAKSGVSGAGKKVTASFIFAEVNENFKAYKVLKHQHTPEINQYLSRLANSKIDAAFVAHLLPINVGIEETIYVQFKSKTQLSTIESIYKKFYKTEKFVRLLPASQQPEIKNVVGTNFCDIALTMDEEKGLLVLTTTIDNLVKGAAGQAVQNMNIMCGFSESEGLI